MTSFAKCHPGEDPETGWVERCLEMEHEPDLQQRFAAVEVLAHYVLQQVLLFGEMCLDRSLNCIQVGRFALCAGNHAVQSPGPSWAGEGWLGTHHLA